MKFTVELHRFMCQQTLVNLVAYDLSLHGHAEAGERAATDLTRGDCLATLRLRQLVGLGLTAIKSLRGEETDVAVPAGDDRQQLLLEHQVNVVHLLIVPNPDYFCGAKKDVGGEDRKISCYLLCVTILMLTHFHRGS